MIFSRNQAFNLLDKTRVAQYSRIVKSAKPMPFALIAAGAAFKLKEKNILFCRREVKVADFEKIDRKNRKFRIFGEFAKL